MYNLMFTEYMSKNSHLNQKILLTILSILKEISIFLLQILFKQLNLPSI